MSILKIIEAGMQNGLVKNWDTMTLDERENFDSIKKGEFISVPCRLVCDHPVTGVWPVDYRLIYKIDAYSPKKRKAWGYAQNLDVPEYSEHGAVYIDNEAYIWETT